MAVDEVIEPSPGAPTPQAGVDSSRIKNMVEASPNAIHGSGGLSGSPSDVSASSGINEVLEASSGIEEMLDASPAAATPRAGVYSSGVEEMIEASPSAVAGLGGHSGSSSVVEKIEASPSAVAGIGVDSGLSSGVEEMIEGDAGMLVGFSAFLTFLIVR